MSTICTYQSTCVPEFRRVSLEDAFDSLGLNQNDKTEVANYFKKYTVPSDYKKYPSWILFRATELVLNFLGHFSSRVESKGKKIEKMIQTHLVTLAPADLNLGRIIVQSVGADRSMQDMLDDVTKEQTKRKEIFAEVIKMRAKQLAHPLMAQARSSARVSTERVVSVEINPNFTSSFFLRVLQNDAHTLGHWRTRPSNHIFTHLNFVTNRHSIDAFV